MPQAQLSNSKPDNADFKAGSLAIINMFVMHGLSLPQCKSVIETAPYLSKSQVAGSLYAISFLYKDHPTGEW